MPRNGNKLPVFATLYQVLFISEKCLVAKQILARMVAMVWRSRDVNGLAMNREDLLSR